MIIFGMSICKTLTMNKMIRELRMLNVLKDVTEELVASKKIATDYGWDISQGKLEKVYDQLCVIETARDNKALFSDKEDLDENL